MYPHDKQTDKPLSEVYKENREERNGIMYVGQSFKLDAKDEEATWQIRRYWVDDSGVHKKDYAGNGQYDQKWSKRFELFERLDFKNEQSIEFDGLNERITFGLAHDIDGPKSMSVWIKPKRITEGTLISKGHDNGYLVDEYFWDIKNGAIRFCLAKSPQEYLHVDSGGGLVRDTWQHVVLTYDGSKKAEGINFYLDGERLKKAMRSESLKSDINPKGDCLLGSKPNSDYFYGHMDEMAIYDKELSKEEVDKLYNDGQPNKMPEDKLSHWYRLGDYYAFPNVPDSIGDVDGMCQQMEKGCISDETPDK